METQGDGGEARPVLTHNDQEALVPGEDGQLWYVFRTRPRREKKAAETFGEMGLRHYLPLRERAYRKRGRQFTSTLPLFAGYVFGCCDLGQRLTAMRSGHLAQWLEVVDQGQLLDELKDIHVATTRKGDSLELFPQLKRGKMVRVMNGPLAGVRGRISRREERFRIVIGLSALGTGVAVEVDMADVELAADEPDELLEAGRGVVRR